MSKAGDDFRELLELIDQFPKKDRYKAIEIAVATIETWISAHDKSA